MMNNNKDGKTQYPRRRMPGWIYVDDYVKGVPNNDIDSSQWTTEDISSLQTSDEVQAAVAKAIGPKGEQLTLNEAKMLYNGEFLFPPRHGTLSGEHPYKCIICSNLLGIRQQSFRSEGQLRQHYKCHLKTHPCEFCNESFTCKSKLRAHLKTKHNPE